MSKEEITKIREYLLGREISEEEKISIEEKLMTSDDYYERFSNVEEDLIEDYLDEQLTLSERKEFEEKFLISDERREKVDFGRLLRSYASEKKNLTAIDKEPDKFGWRIRKILNSFWRTPFLSPIPIAAAFLVIGGIVSFLIFYPKQDEVIVALNKAYSSERPFQSRITSFDYAPTASNLRGETEEKINKTSRKRAENISIEAVEKAETAHNLHNLGRVYLAERQFNDAILQFNRAKNLDSQNAQILSDLGTALFEKSRNNAQIPSGERLLLEGQALEEIDKALQIDPNLLEARFNKAFYLQSRQMPHEARIAWQDYLNLDSTSKWAEEARKNLEVLNSQSLKTKRNDNAVKDFLDACKNGEEEKAKSILSRNGEMISGKLLPQQLAILFLEKEGTERAEYLSALQMVGKLEKENFNDSFFSEIAKFYSSLSERNLALLQEAQNAVKSGYRFSKDNDYQKSLDEFSRAREIFAETGDIWEEKIADYWIAYNLFQLSKNEESNRIFEKLAAFSEIKKYRWLASITFSRIGINAATANKYSKAIEYNKKAINLAVERGELYQQQKSYVQIAEMYQTLKQSPEAFRNIEKAFQLIDNPDTSTRQKSRTYMSAAPIFFEKKLYAMAAHSLEEALSLNEEVKDKTFARYAYLMLSKVKEKAGAEVAAADYAQKSLEVAKSYDEGGARLRAIAHSLIQTADLKRKAGEFQEALKDYDQSIQIYETIDFPLSYYEAKKNRLYCYLEVKEDETISREIEDVLKIFEANRREILEEQNRNSFFDNEQSIYDLAVEYEFSKGNYEKAFNYAETSRARSLLDIQEYGAKLISESNQPQIVFDKRTTSTPLLLNEIRSQLPPQIQLIEYSILRDQVVMWLVTKDVFKAFSYKIPKAELENKVNEFLQSVEQKDNKETISAEELFTILFQPFENHLDKSKQVFIIPDKILFRLPFSALFSSERKQYLVVDYKLTLSPSANVLLNSSANARKHGFRDAEKLLSIGNPKFDQTLFSNLPSLISAEKEAKDIANFYSEAEVLTGDQVTKERFKESLIEANIVHFAGHYVADESSPLLSSFLIAGNGEAGRLTNYELLEQHLSKTKLIVLAACETGLEGYFDGEGAVGAGRIFLASGVPLIIASQWKIDSDATIGVMREFHRFRKTQAMDTISALQKAQVEMLNGENRELRQPFYWAAFSAIGGYTDF